MGQEFKKIGTRFDFRLRAPLKRCPEVVLYTNLFRERCLYHKLGILIGEVPLYSM